MADKLWELKNLQTSEVLLGPIPLPQDWGPIFGMYNIKDMLGNLDWLKSKKYPHHGWIETTTLVPDAAQLTTPLQEIRKKLKQALKDSDWAMLSDVPMTIGKKQEWIDFRIGIRSIRARLKSGILLPKDVVAPSAPSEE